MENENPETPPTTLITNSTPVDPIISMEPIIKHNGAKGYKSVIDPGDSLNGLGFLASFLPFLCYPAFIISALGVKRSRKAGYKGALGIFGMIISGFWLFIVPFTLLFLVLTNPVDKIIPTPIIQTIATVANNNPAVSNIFNTLAGTPANTTAGANIAECENIVAAAKNTIATGDAAELKTTLNNIATTSKDTKMVDQIKTVTKALNGEGDLQQSLTNLITYCATAVQ